MTNAEIGGLVAGIISILVGIAVIAWPRLLAYMVGTLSHNRRHHSYRGISGVKITTTRTASVSSPVAGNPTCLTPDPKEGSLCASGTPMQAHLDAARPYTSRTLPTE